MGWWRFIGESSAFRAGFSSICIMGFTDRNKIKSTIDTDFVFWFFLLPAEMGSPE
jgi:hypothetical protein